jgi:nicotinamidase-related amidase
MPLTLTVLLWDAGITSNPTDWNITMAQPRRALIVVDVQQEYFAEPLEIQYPDRNESLANITRAIDLAEQHGLPIAVVQHEMPEGAPVFVPGTEGWKLHPQVEGRVKPSWKRVSKAYASVFAGTDVEAWLRENRIDTITVIGYMTNNCDLGTAAAAEPLGISVELLSDASGAIHLANQAGMVSAQQLHETLLVLLNSNFAAVASTEEWTQAVQLGVTLPKGDLGSSAIQGREAFQPVA